MVTWAASLSSFAQSPIREIDEAVDRFMQITAATSATVAVSVNGDMVLSQGYGFADSKQRVPTRPVATMRLASCTKPFTRVAIGKLVEGGQLAWDADVFELLSIEPHPNRPVVDPRLHQITLQHLIEHRGGWDRTEFDVMYELDQIKNEMDLSRPLEKRDLVQYMLGRPLPFEPGETKHYSNFGYVLLGLAIEKVSGKSYIEAIRELVGRPLGIDDLAISSTRRKHRHPREVFYPRDSPLDLRLRDSSSGLVSSAPSLCKLMSAYWIDGMPRRQPRDMYFFQIGVHPLTTTTMMEQRLDGIDYALMLNSRREEHYDQDNRDFRKEFNRVLDQVRDQLTQRLTR